MLSIAFFRVATGSEPVFFSDALEGTVDDALCDGLLAVQQNLVDQLGDQSRTVNRIVYEGRLGAGPLRGITFLLLSAVAGASLAATLTPWVSRAPRTIL